MQMASKVIGFRVPEDVAEELEKVSKQRGMTVAEFLRTLVDETLYPGIQLHNEESDNVTREQVESLSNAHRNLADDVRELSALIDRIGVKIAGYEIDGILSPKMLETIQEVETIKNNINNLEYKVDTLSTKADSTQGTVKATHEHKKSTNRIYDSLREDMENLRAQLAPMTALSTKVKQLESEVTRLTTATTTIKREIKRQPTDETHTLSYKDGSEHKFRVYKSKAGLIKPHVVIRDLALGNKYVDLTEPLD
jgi:outer membrane murein-binding lipoprotein Lpp